MIGRADATAQLSLALAFLRDLRANRPAQTLDASVLQRFEDKLESITAVTTLAASDRVSIAEAADAVLRGAIGRFNVAVNSIPADVCRDILVQVLLQPLSRENARRRLADRYEALGINPFALRKRGGIEDTCLEALANLLVEGTTISEDDSTADFSELFLGLAVWLGTDDSGVIDQLLDQLAAANYHVETIKISPLIAEFMGREYQVSSKDDDLVGYLEERMDAGDEARDLVSPALGAQLAIEKITQVRQAFLQSAGVGTARGIAYIIDSLMHPDEVDLLRRTYGSFYFLIGVYEDELSRRARLGEHRGMIARKRGRSPQEAESELDALLQRNRGSLRRRIGTGSPLSRLSIERVFHQADVFVDVANPTRRNADGGLSEFTIENFIAQVFGSPFGVPTRHEAGMAHAYVESMRSGSIARRVGAAVCSAQGELLAAGTNEVPAPMGGQYPTRHTDVREHRFADWLRENGRPDLLTSADTNDEAKLGLLRELLGGMEDLGLLTDVRVQPELFSRPGQAGGGSIVDEVLSTVAELRSAQLFDIIEFTRTVHAEMAAIINAMRRGVSIDGGTLYVTTFPCHECSRHIIMSGIRRVVYIEPYPKSRAADLHPDAIHLGKLEEVDDPKDQRVEYLPFIGIAPRGHYALYSEMERKVMTASGRTELAPWSLSRGQLRETIESRDVTQRMLQRAARRSMEQAIVDALLPLRSPST